MIIVIDMFIFYITCYYSIKIVIVVSIKTYFFLWSIGASHRSTIELQFSYLNVAGFIPFYGEGMDL